MKLKVYNSTAKDLALKKSPFFIGISVGIKPMSPSIAKDYLSWALLHSSHPVQILIADEIAKYNYLVFSHSTKPGALSRALRDGDVYQEFFEKVLNSDFKENLSSFNILRWKDIKGERFFQVLECVTQEFANDPLFQQEVFAILDPYIERRKKSLSLDDRKFLANYLLEEIATLLDGIYVDGINYRSILYPTYRHTGMSQLVSDIQHNPKHVQICDRLGLRPTTMVESLIA